MKKPIIMNPEGKAVNGEPIIRRHGNNKYDTLLWTEVRPQDDPCIKGKKHSFEPRYDYGEPSIKEAEGIIPGEVLQLVEASKSKTYIYDICTKCGKIINRGSDEK